jgi:hypothetical protein
MPPRKFSRHTFTLGVKDEEVSPGALLLSERQPYIFRSFADNRQHTAKEGETLWTLAARYFSPLPRPSGLWWIIADFQPDPIHDPTLRLELGRVLVIPSVRTITEFILSERRRLEPEL